MKKNLIMCSALALGLLSSSFDMAAQDALLTSGSAISTSAAASLPVNPAASSLVWNAKKFGGEHTGTVNLASGVVEVKGNKLTGGSFVIDMTTITDQDITNAEFNQKLTNHLKSADFFSIEQFPTSTFKITKASPVANPKKGEPNYLITGDMTIKGITHPVTFPATVSVSPEAAEATAHIELDRTKWDIKFRSSLLGTAADKVIYDNFTIDLKLKAGAAAASVGSK